MTTQSNIVATKIRLLGVWCSLGFITIWGTAFLLFANWIPPISPSLNADEIAKIFQDDSVRIRVAMAIMACGSVLYLPWTITLAELMQEIEKKSFILTGTQIAGGIVSQLTFFIPTYLWATAAFRPERSPEITQALVDQAWLLFITPIAPFIIQYIAFATAIFMDDKPNPTFPRWLAYLQIWVSLSFLPGLLAYFFKSGPFAWNGFFVWWIPLTLFLIWFVAMFIECRKAVLNLDKIKG